MTSTQDTEDYGDERPPMKCLTAKERATNLQIALSPRKFPNASTVEKKVTIKLIVTSLRNRGSAETASNWAMVKMTARMILCQTNASTVVKKATCLQNVISPPNASIASRKAIELQNVRNLRDQESAQIVMS